jgi:hypothetical protein
VRFRLPRGLTFTGAVSGDVTTQGDEIVFTLGHLAVGGEQTVEIPTLVARNARRSELLRARAFVFSSTALPVETNGAITNVR